MKIPGVVLRMPVILLSAVSGQAIPVVDDFNDRIKDPAKWGADFGSAVGIVERDTELACLPANASVIGDMIRPWILNGLPYDADWEVALDVFLSFNFYYDGEYGAFGLLLWNTGDFTDNIELAGFGKRTSAGVSTRGFEGTMRTNGVKVVDERPFTYLQGMLHLSYSHIARVVTLEVGTVSPLVINWNPIVPDAWNPLGSYGVSAAGGGSQANNDWGMSAGDTFSIGVFGNVVLMGDTFLATSDLFRMAIYPASLWAGAVDLGGGWKSLDWFGRFNENPAGAPWILHEDHGWLSLYGTDTSSVWCLDRGMDTWWWTSATVYPQVYRPSDGAWLSYVGGTRLPRVFHNLSTGLTEEW